ncbi:unnamed protein product [Prunus brigantina]
MHQQILVFIYDESRVLQEYSERLREMGIQLLRRVSKSLGLEERYIEKKMKLESGTIFWDQISINLCRVARMIRIRLGSFLIETLDCLCSSHKTWVGGFR